METVVIEHAVHHPAFRVMFNMIVNKRLIFSMLYRTKQELRHYWLGAKSKREGSEDDDRVRGCGHDPLRALSTVTTNLDLDLETETCRTMTP